MKYLKPFLSILLLFLPLVFSCFNSQNNRCKDQGIKSTNILIQEFKISDTALFSLFDTIRNSFNLKKNDPRILSFILSHNDSTLEFYASAIDSNRFLKDLLIPSSLKIIGYIDNTVPIILLSTINSSYELILFDKLIYPTVGKKKFSYIYFPNNMYDLYFQLYDSITDPKNINFKKYELTKHIYEPRMDITLIDIMTLSKKINDISYSYNGDYPGKLIKTNL